jgi:hypothetical protein
VVAAGRAGPAGLAGASKCGGSVGRAAAGWRRLSRGALEQCLMAGQQESIVSYFHPYLRYEQFVISVLFCFYDFS